MHHLPSPFLALSTSFRRSRDSKSPGSEASSPPSSTTTSPPSSPTSLRHSPPHSSPHHLFNLSFHPSKSHTHTFRDPHSDEKSPVHTSHPHPTSDIPLHNAAHNTTGVSVLPCAVLRGRSSMMVVRRRPSAIDMALSEERSRCDGDSIERQGLGLMEPRPVDLQGRVGEVQPRFVMGGIFEVMEGRA
ncbi:hypothetical protein PENARI_c003G02756 [Penicillium arizonense]|uniref:Uncharacterized protein n=1 Tax=Penicillium arizonense TaxID=1835702 RepID=A0A1F5LS70_PENAI|nr:hypothetical protein PENARI_c003G02756 [Penicillium arizonense]OGE55977.1 hypothetical protein PENARI_c003G02756 [Penicillium arizonense]